MRNDLPVGPDSSGVPAGVDPAPELTRVSDTRLGNGLAAEGIMSDIPAGTGGIGKYFSTLNRYKWWALAILVLGTSVGVVGSRLVHPTYLVQAKVWFDRDVGGARGPIQEGQLLDSQSWTELLHSYAVLDEVVQQQRLYLVSDPAHKALFSGFQIQSRFYPGEYRIKLGPDHRSYVLETQSGRFVEKAAIGDSLGRKLGFAWVPGRGPIDERRGVAFSVRRPRDRARELGKELVTNMPKDGSFMQIELSGEDPAEIAGTLNALVARFVSLAAELKRSRVSEFAAILSEQLRVAEHNLQSAEMALENLRVNTITEPTESPGAVSAGTQETRSPLLSTFIKLKVQQEQLKEDRAALQRALIRARDSAVSTTELQLIGAVQTSGELQQALNELTTKRSALRALQYRYTDDFADIRKLKGELQTLERETIPLMITNLIAELDRRDNQTNQMLGSATTEMRAIPPRVMEEARLTRQVTIADAIYTMLRQRHEEARLAALSSTPDVRVVDQAVMPHSPVKDQSARVLGGAIAGSLALIVLGVLLLEKMDTRVRYPEHVTHGLRLPILAAIPRLKNGRANGHKPSDNTPAVVEAFRTLRLSVLQARGTQGTFVMAITSPGAGDGKSFVAMNLAGALADQGYRTLLIDGDIRRGALHQTVGTARKPGLTDLLAGNAHADEVIRRTGYPLLDLIPSGKRVQAGPELLGSPALSELIQKVRGNYSVVLIDTPPLGAGIDPFVLSMAAGTLLLVVRTGQSDRDFTEAKLAALDRLPIRILGAALNAVPGGRAYRYYGYLPGYEANEETRPAAEKRLPVPS